MSRYRPYQDGVSPGNAKFAFKPSFRYFDGDVEFLPNPLHGRITVPEVRELAISVAHTDYWAQGWARVLPDFPYSLQIRLRTGSYAVQSRIRTPHYLTNIWNTDEGRAVMTHLLRRFATGAQHHQTHAVLLLIPDVNAWRDGRTAPAYADFVHRDLVLASLGLTVIDVAKTAFDERRFSLMPFEGHASVYGNTVIADTVLERLKPMLEAARSAGAHGQ